MKRGISDETHDDILDNISPEGYYRATYQTKEYIAQEWSKYFEILEHKEAGALNYQDLIVMRKR